MSSSLARMAMRTSPMPARAAVRAISSTRSNNFAAAAAGSGSSGALDPFHRAYRVTLMALCAGAIAMGVKECLANPAPHHDEDHE